MVWNIEDFVIITVVCERFATLSWGLCEVSQHIHLHTLGRVMGLLFLNPWWCCFPTLGCAIHQQSSSSMYTLWHVVHVYSSSDSLLRCLHNPKAIIHCIKWFTKLHTQARDLLWRSTLLIDTFTKAHDQLANFCLQTTIICTYVHVCTA